MFNSITVAAALFVASVFTGHAQQTLYFGALTGSTLNGALGVSTNNTVPASTTNVYYATYTQTNTVFTNGVISGTNILNVVSSTNSLTCPVGTKVISIQPMFTMSGNGSGGATNETFRIDNSSDNANWNNGVTNISIAELGTNEATGIVQLNTGGIKFWRVGAVQNPANVPMTNAAVSATFGL